MRPRGRLTLGATAVVCALLSAGALARASAASVASATLAASPASSTSPAPSQTPGAASQPSAPPTSAAPRLALQPNDRIILLGNTQAERQQLFNHFETLLMTRFPDLRLVVRNLGWSGDTVTLQPRPLNFGDAATHLKQQQADVILAFFGLNESFAGEAGLPKFEQELDTWLRTQLDARYNGRAAPRLALVSPIAHERLARLPRVDVEARNAMLARYTESMRTVAARHAVPLVDLFTPTRALMAAADADAEAAPLTINGIHVSPRGDRVTAALLMNGLGFGERDAMRSPTSTAERKALAALRELIRDKNQQFFYRWRPVNAEYIVGRRVEPFGSVNFPKEMAQLDQMVSERDRSIWTRALALKGVRFGDEAPAPATAAPPRSAEARE